MQYIGVLFCFALFSISPANITQKAQILVPAYRYCPRLAIE